MPEEEKLRKSINDLSNNLKDSLLSQDRELKNLVDKNISGINTLIKDSKFSDNNISKLLNELNNSSNNTESYNLRIQELTKQYLKNSELGTKEQQKVTKVLNDIKSNDLERTKLQDIQYKKEARDNPFVAFKQGFEELKKGSTLKEAGSTTLDTFKSGLSIKNITKGLLHTAGIITDNPALNILATELKSNTEGTEEEINKTEDFIESLNQDSTVKDDTNESNESIVPIINPVISDFSNTLDEEKEINNNIKNMDLEEIKKVLESSYLDHGALLEDIRDESLKHSVVFRELLFNQRDSMDDKTSNDSVVVGTSESNQDEEEVGAFDSAIDGIVGFGSNKGGKGTKGKGLSKALGGIRSLLPVVGSVLSKVAAPLAVGVALYDGFQGFKNVNDNLDLDEGEIATLSQKVSSSIGEIANTLSFGLLGIKDTAKFLESSVQKVKGFFSIDNLIPKNTDIVEEIPKDIEIDNTSSLASTLLNQASNDRTIENKEIQKVEVTNTNSIVPNVQSTPLIIRDNTVRKEKKISQFSSNPSEFMNTLQLYGLRAN